MVRLPFARVYSGKAKRVVSLRKIMTHSLLYDKTIYYARELDPLDTWERGGVVA